jgi:excisionase family DNA binding protein
MTSDRSSGGLPAAALLLLTIKQVAESLQVSQRTVHRLIKDGRLKVVRIRGSVRVRPEDRDSLINES